MENVSEITVSNEAQKQELKGNVEMETIAPEKIAELKKIEAEIKAAKNGVDQVEDKIKGEDKEKNQLVFAIGRNLALIRTGKLYQAAKDKEGKPFANIGDYAEEKFYFKKSYVSQVEKAASVLDAVSNARTKEADFDLPESINAAYVLAMSTGVGAKAVLDVAGMVEVLTKIKQAGGEPTAKTIKEYKPTKVKEAKVVDEATLAAQLWDKTEKQLLAYMTSVIGSKSKNVKINEIKKWLKDYLGSLTPAEAREDQVVEKKPDNQVNSEAV